MNDSLSGKSILVIDDDAALLRAIDKVLSSEGAQAICVQWGGDGAEILSRRDQPVDLVITDLRMPVLNGITVVNAVHRAYPGLPVMVLTAYGSPEVRAVCVEQGAVAFLEKPLDSRQLISTIQDILNSPKQEREQNSPNTMKPSEETPARAPQAESRSSRPRPE